MTEQRRPSQPDLLAQILDYANRANPYPLYAELRKTPVLRAPNGSYVVSTYREIMALMHDPRIGVGGIGARRRRRQRAAACGAGSFIGMDPPEHDRLRRLATSHFEQTEAVRPDMLSTATDLIDRMQGRQQIDLVDDFAYPLPVTVICQQLGVPHEDEPRFHPWADAIITALDPRPGQQDGRRPGLRGDEPVHGRAGRAVPRRAGHRTAVRAGRRGRAVHRRTSWPPGGCC